MTLDSLNEFYKEHHNSSEPNQKGEGDTAYTCGLCGVKWDWRLMARDEGDCEYYCPDCIKDGEVERYLIKNEYTPEMIKEVINTIKIK